MTKPCCIIVDANVFHCFCATPMVKSASVIAREVNKGNLRIASGGRNWGELIRLQEGKRWLVERLRSGHAVRYDDAVVDAEESKVAAARTCRSDDPHVIALAKISGAKLLFSQDQALHDDFKRVCGGAVYQDETHAHLLRRRPPCR
jgi:hypothetical protein